MEQEYCNINGVDTIQRLSKQRHHKTATVTKQRHHKTATVTKQRQLQNSDSYKTATVTKRRKII